MTTGTDERAGEELRTAYYRKYPLAIVQDFLHERYGDCMEDRTAAELHDRLAKYGHAIGPAALSPPQPSERGLENRVALTAEQSREGRSSTAALIEFARWAISEGPWEGCSLDGGSIQDKAESLGLIVKTAYDPAVHGESYCDAEAGGDWYVFAPALTKAVEERTSEGPPQQDQRGSPKPSERDAVLEEAAKIADETTRGICRGDFGLVGPAGIGRNIAAAIRALKSTPPQGSGE